MNPTNQKLKVSATVRELLCCPACHNRLIREATRLSCGSRSCGVDYPIVDGIPVLIDDGAGVFLKNDFLAGEATTLALPKKSLSQTIKRVLPRLGRNLATARNYENLREMLVNNKQPRVLVIGGSITGDGMAVLLKEEGIEFVETDVSFGPRTQIICDGHSIPFFDGSFDAVIIQAVIHCLIDPAKVVREIRRVLKPDGLVYAEAPFLQQVINSPYDFQRFTKIGLRKLFREFAEVESGIVSGPGTALAWSIQFFFLTFFTAPAPRGIVRVLCSLTLFWLKYLDPYLVKNRRAADAASGFFFMGRKSLGPACTDRMLVRTYEVA
jgi:uncharacterized protein YbaR (Trm112 family)